MTQLHSHLTLLLHSRQTLDTKTYVDTPARARDAARVTHRSSDAGGTHVDTVGVVERTTRVVDDVDICATKFIASIGGETPTDDATRRDDRW